MIWYFNAIRIAQITDNQSKICTDKKCKERFSSRLKLDHQTGSLTIMNIRITHSGEYKLKIISSNSDSEKIFNVSVHDVPAAERDEMKRKEGDSVTLHPGEIKSRNYLMAWYFNDILIAEITGDQNKICTNKQCDERFRDRLKLGHQTGTLTIMNIKNTDSGNYILRTDSSRFSIIRRIFVTVNGEDREPVFVIEGDSVTLHTGVNTNQEEKMIWYFNAIRIAQITDNQSKICKDIQCKERFSERLKLDHQTGSLTIMNIRITHSGEYKLKIISSNIDSEKIFNVSLHDVPAAELEIKRKEGDSVTLHPGEIKNKNYLMMWYFNDVLITGDQSKICTDVQCDERFRDRLKLDHQTGSLTIMNITHKDSGNYTLRINSSRFSIIRRFSVTVTDSGLTAAIIGGVTAVVLLLAAIAGVIYCWHRSRRKGTRAVHSQDKVYQNCFQSHPFKELFNHLNTEV